MKDGIAISINHVTKRFSLNAGRGTSIKHLVVDAFRRRGGGASDDVFTALSDVCLDVRKGETLGIIGRNGAGKSTLLSIIAGTITPTEGHVESDGKISSLLELGAGFHPDLTGRENVFLYGAIMGVPKAEMKALRRHRRFRRHRPLHRPARPLLLLGDVCPPRVLCGGADRPRHPPR